MLNEAILRIADNACVKNEYREQFIKDLQTLREAEEVLHKIAAPHNVPVRYAHEGDDVGECPYCSGWNLQHKDNCELRAARRVLGIEEREG